MQRLPNATQRLVVALLVGIVAIPATSTGLFLDAQMKRSALQEEEARILDLQDNAQRRAAQRRFFRAIEEFQSGTSARDSIVKPSAGETGGSEGESAVTSLSIEELDTPERELLRKYVRARSCPASLKLSPIAGFYELCLSLVGSGAANALPTGLGNHTAYIKRQLRKAASNLPAFKLRMQMLEEAENGEKRDAGQLPGRPTNCVKSVDCK